MSFKKPVGKEMVISESVRKGEKVFINLLSAVTNQIIREVYAFEVKDEKDQNYGHKARKCACGSCPRTSSHCQYNI